MGKVKIKRKSTLIDMTAMSDVTVLLLTFFMLTSTFLAKEPTVVNTPSSVSEEKVPMNNLVTILVSGKDKLGKEGNPTTEGKVFISFTGDKDSTLSSEHIREMMLVEALKIYNEQHPSAKVTLSAKQMSEFKKLNMFGLPFRGMPKFLDMEQSKRDEYQGNMEDPTVGIPIDGTHRDRKGKLNEFQIWMQAVYNVAQRINKEQSESGADPTALENLYTALMKKGEGIAVKADKNTPYSTVHLIFDNLQTMKLNKFTLMTALKSEDEPTN